jgi:hypothetical protein
MSNDTQSALTTTSSALLPETIPPEFSGGSLAIYLNKPLFDQLCRAASLLSKSDIVPKQFQGKEGNCFIALEMAGRMNVNTFMLMQNMCVVNGKPGIEAKLIIALINNSGLFAGPLMYETEGTSPKYDRIKKVPVDPAFRMRAYAAFKSTGEIVYGPWIDWDIVQGEGWVQKDGSKWKTMPDVMFEYRAATFFSRTKCPNITLGMTSVDELIEITDYTVTDTTTGVVTQSPKAKKAASILSGVAAGAETAQSSEKTATEEKTPPPQPANDPSQQDSGAIVNDNELLQKVFVLLEQISVAKNREETPDDVLDGATKSKYGTQTDLMNAMEDKKQVTTAYITGFLLTALDAELQKLTAAA